MATFHDRTVAPKFQRGLLRSAGSPCRVLTSAEVVDLVEATEPVSARFGENPSPDTVLHDGAERHDILAVGISRGDIPTLEVPRSGERKIAPNDLRALAQKPAQVAPVSAQPAEPDTAAQAQALHARRELHQALDYGFALLDALDLSPRGLDIIDGAIAHLDAMDAPDADLEEGGDTEPSLGWIPGQSQLFRDYQDCELDTADAEEDDPAEETSLETAGRGFVRCGADDDEEDDGCERGEEYGSEDGEDIGHHASQFTPRPLTHAESAEVAVIATRAAAMRRLLHV